MIKQLGILSLAAAICVPVAAQGNVYVTTWWGSAGELAALKVLKDGVARQGLRWSDVPLVGVTFEGQYRGLRSRVDTGDPPEAVLMHGVDVLEWGRHGVLADLNELAARDGWDQAVPPALQTFSKFNGKWVGVALNVHSTNWVWANLDVLAKSGVTSEPTTFDEFIADAEKVQKAGFVAIAQGAETWEDATVFENVALSTGGVDYYRKAFMKLDAEALNSATTLKVFQRMTQMRKLTDRGYAGHWDAATAAVVRGKAGFQIMGDWAKGEFVNAKKEPGKDFACFRFPGTQGAITAIPDMFAMFKQRDPASVAAQMTLAATMMDPGVQSAFNVLKGSAPFRADVPDTAFDACGKRAIKELAEAVRSDSVVGSIAHGSAIPTSSVDALSEVISRQFSGRIDDTKAMTALAAAGEAQRRAIGRSDEAR